MRVSRQRQGGAHDDGTSASSAAEPTRLTTTTSGSLPWSASVNQASREKPSRTNDIADLDERQGVSHLIPRDTGPYRVYLPRSKSQANVHAVGCRSLGQHGGLQRGHPENSRYSHLIDTFEAAWEWALARNKRVTHAHTHCLPDRDDYRWVTR